MGIKIQISREALFGDLLLAAGFSRNAWKKMPGFNIAEFVEFAWWNWKAGVIRLVGYYGTPHDGAYRSVSDTELGVRLIRYGNAARGRILLKEYTCSAAAGVASEGGGAFKGYSPSAWKATLETDGAASWLIDQRNNFTAALGLPCFIFFSQKVSPKHSRGGLFLNQSQLKMNNIDYSEDEFSENKIHKEMW